MPKHTKHLHLPVEQPDTDTPELEDLLDDLESGKLPKRLKVPFDPHK